MKNVQVDSFKLIGLALNKKTSNENGQSGIDGSKLWQEFTTKGYADSIPNKLSDEMIAVYHDYEGDHTKPFTYFIGCKVPADAEAPDDMDSLTIPSGTYQKRTAKGKMPDCIINAWKEIWSSDIPRAYQKDFEVYDERSRDWNNAEIDVYLSVE